MYYIQCTETALLHMACFYNLCTVLLGEEKGAHNHGGRPPGEASKCFYTLVHTRELTEAHPLYLFFT